MSSLFSEMPIDYSKGDHFADSDGESKPSSRKPAIRVVPARLKPKQLYLEKLLFAGVATGLLDIRYVINAAVTGIVYFVFTMTLGEFACWCPWHSLFHAMPILAKEYDPFYPIFLVQNFYTFMFSDAEGQEFYHGDLALLNGSAELTPEESWAAFMDFRKWQIQNIDDFMSSGILWSMRARLSL